MPFNSLVNLLLLFSSLKTNNLLKLFYAQNTKQNRNKILFFILDVKFLELNNIIQHKVTKNAGIFSPLPTEDVSHRLLILPLQLNTIHASEWFIMQSLQRVTCKFHLLHFYNRGKLFPERDFEDVNTKWAMLLYVCEVKKSPSIWELMQWTRAGFNYVEVIGYSKTQTGKLPQS